MTSENTTIHVRFASDGSVIDIGERPDGLTPQQWFNWLSLNAADNYRAYAGGRGAFSLTPGSVDMLQRTSLAP